MMTYRDSRFVAIQYISVVALVSLIIALIPSAAPRLAYAAPAAPRALQAVAVTTNEIALSWSASNSLKIAGYAIFRDRVQLTTVTSMTLTYTDTTVTFGTRYRYSVVAIATDGNRSAPSNSAHCTTPEQPDNPDTEPPSPPRHVTATVTPGAILLDWSDASDNTEVTAYRIYRNMQYLATVNSGTRQYTDTTVQAGKSYRYSVEAVDVGGLRSAAVVQATAATHAPTGTPPVPASGSQDAAPAQTPAYSAKLKRYPYLTDLVNDPVDLHKAYVTINWATDRSSSTGSAKWGAVASDGSCSPKNSVAAERASFTVNSVSEYQWKAALTLVPGTQYCYRVYLSSTDLLGSDPTPSFWTQVPIAAQDPFSFAVFGDWGATEPTGTSGANPHQANLMQQIAASGVRFALTAGDNAYPSGSQTNYGDLVESAPNISGVFGPGFWTVPGKRIPIFPAIGNHGFTRSDTNHPHLLNWPQEKAVATSAGRYTKECCIGSSNYVNAWYAFDAGIARFYVLQAAWADSCSPSDYACDYSHNWSPSSAEYQWLENDLRTHPSALKFVVFHYPLYSDQKDEASDSFLQGIDSLEGLLSRYGVDLAFYGHAHLYQRNLKPNANSVLSYLTGGGGAKSQSIGELSCAAVDAYGIGWSNTNNRGNACGSAPVPNAITQVYHFLKVSVNATSVVVTPTDELGRSFDVQTYTFPAPNTIVDSGPSDNGTSTSATFSFSSNSADTTFECRLDGVVFSACVSPQTYENLTPETHTFEVRATNGASDADATPARWIWTVAGTSETPTQQSPTTSVPTTPAAATSTELPTPSATASAIFATSTATELLATAPSEATQTATALLASPTATVAETSTAPLASPTATVAETSTAPLASPTATPTPIAGTPTLQPVSRYRVMLPLLSRHYPP